MELVPEDIAEDILSNVDQPLQVAKDKKVQKQYLLCDYNRDGDSYRSPWSNEYEPANEEGIKPSDKLRKLETAGNEVFEQYCGQYYNGGISSFYLWDDEDDEDSFAGSLLFKKDCGKMSKSGMEKGVWDAMHVVEAVPKKTDTEYKLTSTIMLSAIKKDMFKLEGNLTRQLDRTLPTKQGHVSNVGMVMEELEGSMRNSLQQVSPQTYMCT